MIGMAIGLFWTAYESYRTNLLDDKVDRTQAQVNLDRVYALFRDSVIYYDLVRASHDYKHLGHRSYPGQAQALREIKTIYCDFLKIRDRFEELREDNWYQIEKDWKPAINSWIDELNQSTKNNPGCQVVPLP